MDAAAAGLFVATFLASFVEFVEALTIVLAMGTTRGWRPALAGTGGAVVVLAALTAVAGYSLTTWLPESALQLVVGALLLVFGLQWLRKAVLRAAGLKALHDEDTEYAAQTATARDAGARTLFGLDAFGLVVSFKGVLLEGVEVVFVVVTLGLSADDVPVAVLAAALAGLLVVGLGLVVHRPLAAIPENTLKYGVGLLLATFGTYWVVEGVGLVSGDGDSLQWPGGGWSILVLLAVWVGLSRALVAALRTSGLTGQRPPERVS